MGPITLVRGVPGEPALFADDHAFARAPLLGAGRQAGGLEHVAPRLDGSGTVRRTLRRLAPRTTIVLRSARPSGSPRRRSVRARHIPSTWGGEARRSLRRLAPWTTVVLRSARPSGSPRRRSVRARHLAHRDHAVMMHPARL